MSDAPEPKCAKLFCIPHRFILGIMTSFAIVNCYTMRVSLSTAITEMILNKDKSNFTGPCVNITADNKSLTTVSDDYKFDWSPNDRGVIMSSFYFGYILSHIPGGMLADRYGAKHVLGVGVLITAILTCLTPTILYACNGNKYVFITVRFLEGLFEGQSYPAANVILGQWIPIKERGTWGSVVYAGSQFGTILSNLISGHLIAATNSWASVFYFFGGLAMVWWVIWLALCYNNPTVHPCIRNKEKEYLRVALATEHVSYGDKPIPWIPIMTNKPMWSLVCVQIGHDWGWFTMVTDLPKYMKNVLGYNVQDNGTMSSIPYVIMWIVSVVSGFLCDFLIEKKYLTLTNARKLFNSIGAIGPAIFLLAVAFSGCSKLVAVIMFTCALGTMGTFYCGLKVNALDLSPNYAGTLMAFSNGIGSFTGLVTSYLTSAITPQNTFFQWRIIFISAFCFLFFTNFAFLFYGSGEEQWWNDTSKVIEYNNQRKAAKEAKALEKEAAKKAKELEKEAAKNAKAAGTSRA